VSVADAGAGVVSGESVAEIKAAAAIFRRFLFAS
jgi:hypothetical protein